MYLKEKQKLLDGFNSLTPDLLQSIKQQPVQQIESEAELFGLLQSEPEQRRNRVSHKFVYVGVTAAAAIFFLFISNFLFSRVEENQIIIDVNPSISIKVDDENCITGLEELNEDSAVIMEKIPETDSLEETMSYLLKALKEEDYFSDQEVGILVTYAFDVGETPDAQVRLAVKEFQEQEELDVTLIEQTIRPSELLKKTAREQNISIGKCNFIKLLEKKYQLDTKDMPYKKIEEIITEVKEKGIDLKKGLDGEEKNVTGAEVISFSLSEWKRSETKESFSSADSQKHFGSDNKERKKEEQLKEENKIKKNLEKGHEQQSFVPVVKQSPVPEVKQTLAPEVKQTSVPEIKQTSVPKVKQTSMPEVKQTTVPNMKLTPTPKTKQTIAPKENQSYKREEKASPKREDNQLKPKWEEKQSPKRKERTEKSTDVFDSKEDSRFGGNEGSQNSSLFYITSNFAPISWDNYLRETIP